MEALMDCLLLGLAVRALLDAWLHDPGLFTEWRSEIYTWGMFVSEVPDSDPPLMREPSRWERCKEKLSQLATCRRCLGYHAAFWLTIGSLLPSWLLPPPWSTAAKLPLVVLAGAGLAFTFHKLCQPNHESDSPN